MWKEQEEKNVQKSGSRVDEEMKGDSDSAEDDDQRDKKHRHLFERTNQNMYGYDSEDDYGESSESDEDSDDYNERNAFNT